MLYVLTAADLGGRGARTCGTAGRPESSPICTTAPCSIWPAKARPPPSTSCSSSAATAIRSDSARRKTIPGSPPRRSLARRLSQCHAAAAGGRRLATAARHGAGDGGRPTAQYLAETATVQFTIGTSEQITPRHLPQAHRGPDQPRPGNPHARRSTLWPTAWCWTVFGSTIRISPASRRRTASTQVEQSLVRVVVRSGGQAARVSPHLASRRPRLALRPRPAHPGEHRQQHLRPLHDHRHFHAGPRRPALRHHADAVRDGAFGLPGEDRHRFWTRWSTSSTSPIGRTARSRTRSGWKRFAAAWWR